MPQITEPFLQLRFVILNAYLIFNHYTSTFLKFNHLQDQFHFGDLVSFQCDFGYIMSGSASLLCTSGGIWNGTVPECQCKNFSLY